MSTTFTKKIPVLLEQSLFSGMGFLTNIVLAKLMDLEQYGLYASLILVIYFFLGISQSLVIQPMQVHISKKRSEYSYFSFLLILQCSLILAFSLFLVVVSLANFNFLRFSQTYLLLFTVYMASFLLFDFFRKFFLASGQTKRALAITISYSIAAVGLFLFAVSSQFSGNLSTYLPVLVASYLLPLTVAAVLYCRGLVFPQKDTLEEYLKTHLIEGQWLLYAAIVQWFSGNLYVMASGLFIGLEALGVLRFVQSLLGVINILLQTIENFILPQLSRAYEVSLQHCYRSFQRSLGVYQVGILSGLALLFVFAEEVLHLAGNATFTPYAYVLRGMVILYAIIIIAYPLRLLIRVTELNKSYFTAYLISFFFSLLSYHFLLTHFGVSGAIIGLILNQLILQATWLKVLSKNQFNVWKLYIS